MIHSPICSSTSLSHRSHCFCSFLCCNGWAAYQTLIVIIVRKIRHYRVKDEPSSSSSLSIFSIFFLNSYISSCNILVMAYLPVFFLSANDSWCVKYQIAFACINLSFLSATSIFPEDSFLFCSSIIQTSFVQLKVYSLSNCILQVKMANI